MIHPWRVLKGEACPEVDRTILGQTGDQINQVAAAKLDPFSRRTSTFANSFSPRSLGLSAHWDRLLRLIPRHGVHRIILCDATPEGSEAPAPVTGPRSFGPLMTSGGATLLPGLRELVPEFFEGGYTEEFRCDFLRRRKIDPIDLVDSFATPTGPPDPYFDAPMRFGPPRMGPYGGVHFPSVQRLDTSSLIHDWQEMRHLEFGGKLEELTGRLSGLGVPSYVETPPRRGQMTAFGLITWADPLGRESGGTGGPKDGAIDFLGLNPLNAEDENGNLVFVPYIPKGHLTCFDFSEVPPAQFGTYVQYVFGMPK